MSELENLGGVTPPARKQSRKLLVPLAIAAAVLAMAAVALKLAGVFDRDTPGPAETGQYIDVATYNYYGGIIEPQTTWEIQRDADREIAEVYVEVGDAVTTGQKLFAYDTTDTQMQLQQAQLELDGIGNEIDGYAGQIAELTDLRAGTADEATKLGYSEQINELESARRQAQLDRQSKQLQMENLRKSLDNAVVTSTMDGTVKQISSRVSYEQTAYMTVLAAGAYQVKATVDELNVSSLQEGMAVKVHSRVDAERIWDGTITKIDTENAADSGQGASFYGYDEGGSSENRATRYYFYVSLTASDGLMLGQHVYVEPLMDDADAAPDGEDAAVEDAAVEDAAAEDAAAEDAAPGAEG